MIVSAWVVGMPLCQHSRPLGSGPGQMDFPMAVISSGLSVMPAAACLRHVLGVARTRDGQHLR